MLGTCFSVENFSEIGGGESTFEAIVTISEAENGTKSQIKVTAVLRREEGQMGA